MGDTTPNHSSNSEYEIPTFYSIGALDSLGGCWDLEVFAGVHDAGFCPSAADKAPGRHFGHRRVGPDSVPETQSHPESRNALFCQLASDDGTLVSQESLALHRFDLEQMEGETYIVSYTNRFIADPLRTSFLF